MITETLAVGVAALVAGLGLAAVLSRGRTLRMQLIGLAALGVSVPLLAVMLSGVLMFSGRDLRVLGWASVAASAAFAGAWLLSRRIRQQITRLRAAPAAVAGGDLSARAPRGGAAELDELAAGFNAMADRLEELFDARRRLVAWAGHDLRSPVASLRLMIEAVEDGLAEPREFVTRMRGEVDALGAMIDDLFELARLDAGDLRLDVRVEPAAALVERALERARVLAGAKGVQVSAAVAPGTASVCCAPEKVDRVLDNLLANAVRHTPSHGRVTLGVEPCGDEVQLTVEDSGEGLSNETLTRMFDHFWRGDASRRRDGAGAGLGLAIARGLVEAQGGRIWAENRRPSGARVVFTLPAGAVSGTPGGNQDEPAGAPLLG
ncbi:MAG: HAMP domain-containing sensor histidine kinase [Thermoleophilia bacterium]